MNLVEKLQAVIRFGQYSPGIDRKMPVRLYYYEYDNSRTVEDDPLNGKIVFDVSLPTDHGEQEFHAETLEEAVNNALVYLHKKRKKAAAEFVKQSQKSIEESKERLQSVEEFEIEIFDLLEK